MGGDRGSGAAERVASAELRALVRSSPAQLEALLRSGRTPDVEQLVGEELLGACTAPWLRLVGMRKLLKGFERQPDGRITGYNRRVAQDGFDAPWTSPSAPFAGFGVRAVDPSARTARYPGALVLDYAAAPGARLAPWRPIRDHLVCVAERPVQLLLGRAFYAVGPLRPSFTYFVLQRAT